MKLIAAAAVCLTLAVLLLCFPRSAAAVWFDGSIGHFLLPGRLIPQNRVPIEGAMLATSGVLLIVYRWAKD